MRVVVNAAMSADGKLSTRERTQVAISGEADFDRVAKLRAESDAIMVGVGTVLADDPSLTIDGEAYDPDENPVRVVADSRVRTPADATVLNDEAPTYLLVNEVVPNNWIDQMEEAGAYVIVAGDERVDLETALAELEDEERIDQLMVEGGGELIFSLFEADLVDELSVFVGPQIIGGRDAPTLADGDGFTDNFPELDLVEVERIDDGVLLRYDVP
jgi:2,5-diamino-6-(ribosylamino)-4(3H)-pyrimidinone 5'-phosphate reductase